MPVTTNTVPIYDANGNVLYVVGTIYGTNATVGAAGHFEGNFIVGGDLANIAAVDANGALLVTEEGYATATVTATTMATSSTQILGANGSRTGAMVFAESANPVYLRLGAAVGTTAGSAPYTYSIQVAAGKWVPVPFNYTGALHALQATVTAGDRVLVTEVSP